MFPGLDYSQWLRWGKLVKHYHLHQEEAITAVEQEGFLDFLVELLLEQDDHLHQDGKDHHQQLPFQQMQSVSTFCFIPDAPLKASHLISPSKVNFFFSHPEGVLYQQAIFQPPV